MRAPHSTALFRRFAAAFAALCLGAGLAVSTATSASAAGANYVESDTANPTTALPPVSAPPTPHCAVTVMRHDFANSYGAPFVGTVTPPKDCPGPWNKVVMTWTGSVAGRQYDRLAGVWLGGAEIFRTSTPEPDAAGITWHADADLTRFIPLLRSPQPLVVDLGNLVNDTYTGVYHITMTFTYYETTRAYPAAHTADDVIPVSGPDATTQAGWWTLNAGQSATTSVTLPRNTDDLQMDVYARGGGCDEQWFDDVPNDLASQDPDYLCGGGPYREVQVSIDGRPAGIAQPYSVVYSGGIVPTLWIPVPAIDQIETQSYRIDLTPFVGLLVDGKPHTVTITPYGDSDYWQLDGDLFVTTDHGSSQTSGVLTQDTLGLTPDIHTTETPKSDGSTDVAVSAKRDYVTAGYVNTSRGRVSTRVSDALSFSNNDLVSSGGEDQDVTQSQNGAETITTTGGGAPSVEHRAWSYPLRVDSQVPLFTDDNNFELSATVYQERKVSDTLIARGHARVLTSYDDQVGAQGELARSNGVTSESDGSDWEHWQGLTDNGGYWNKIVAGDHGQLTEDRLLN
jgi:hypothetical protein